MLILLQPHKFMQLNVEAGPNADLCKRDFASNCSAQYWIGVLDGLRRSLPCSQRDLQRLGKGLSWGLLFSWLSYLLVFASDENSSIVTEM